MLVAGPAYLNLNAPSLYVLLQTKGAEGVVIRGIPVAKVSNPRIRDGAFALVAAAVIIAAPNR